MTFADRWYSVGVPHVAYETCKTCGGKVSVLDVTEQRSSIKRIATSCNALILLH